MQADINTLTSTRVPRGLTELITLGRTLKRRAGDILAYFDHPHTTGGPTEAINGRLEHLRGTALGLAKPHQLHHPSTPRNRRIQTPTTPPIMKSPETSPTTSPEHSSKPEDSDPNYTPNYEEPEDGLFIPTNLCWVTGLGEPRSSQPLPITGPCLV